jgi:hypothetical protein
MTLEPLLEQLEVLEGENRGVGDTSTAYLARKL